METQHPDADPTAFSSSPLFGSGMCMKEEVWLLIAPAAVRAQETPQPWAAKSRTGPSSQIGFYLIQSAAEVFVAYKTTTRLGDSDKGVAQVPEESIHFVPKYGLRHRIDSLLSIAV